MMDNNKVEQMLDVLRAKADEGWKAMYGTHQYKYIVKTLEKRPEEVSFGERALVGNSLRALCAAMGVNYYQLLNQVCV